MNKNQLAAASKLRLGLMGAAFVGSLAAMVYGFTILQSSDGISADARELAGEMQLLSRQIMVTAAETVDGQEKSFAELGQQVELFEESMGQLESAELANELSQVEVAWQPVKRSAQTLIDAGPRIALVQGVATQFESDLKPMQAELVKVADGLDSSLVSQGTVVAVQKTLWLSEKIDRGIDAVLAGAGEEVVPELRADAGELLQIIEGLTRGDLSAGISRLSDARAVDSLSTAFRLLSPVSTFVGSIADAAPELSSAVAARNLILMSGRDLGESVSDLSSAVNLLTAGSAAQRGTLTTLIVGLGLLAIGLLVMLFITQRRPSHYTRQGIAAINDALVKIAEGNLTVKVPENNAVTSSIAHQLNAATSRQRELLENVRAPFQLSVEEINHIGISARAQVEKAKELTRSVGESTAAATEMVRTSEEIKTSTAEAATTAERNCQQVAQGYELTKDMSKASVDVRESVQETSKSAKRQGELIQSVTAAAEYIQALNTKISVVAINTRIEAEKAGEYGRPFLGIAEAIADLLREAGEEGRKIISEVRMLQNMSAENLASMENTVGTVVTILEYIERLDSSLEEINSGSDGISSIIRSVDDAAGQSAVSALHMNNSMAQIRERSGEIGRLSESTRTGVARLQRSMHQAASGMEPFQLNGDSATVASLPEAADVDDLEQIAASSTVYREEDMTALEGTDGARVSV